MSTMLMQIFQFKLGRYNTKADYFILVLNNRVNLSRRGFNDDVALRGECHLSL